MSLFIAKPSSSRPLARTRTSTALALSLAISLTASAAMAQTPVPTETQPAASQTTVPAQPAAPTAAPQQTPPAQTAPTMSRVPADAPVAAPAQPATTTPAAPASSAVTPPSAAPAGGAQPVTPTTAAQPNAGEQAAPVQTVPAQAGSAVEASPAAPANPAQRSDIPHDLSPWGMFLAAHWVVKAVMIGLAAASLITWTVWLAKTLELFGARSRAGRTLKLIRKARTLSEALEAAGTRGGPAALMLRAAAEEVQLSEGALDHAENAGVKERVASTLSRIEAYAGRRMARGTGVLATIGSTAPFVGLFGTVWGIMNAFIGISESHTTNLAVVAPGIAEALLATAIGLVAAIPAVVIYNVFARSVTGYRQLLADASAGVERLVSRDLDYRKVPPGSRSKSTVSLVAGG